MRFAGFWSLSGLVIALAAGNAAARDPRCDTEPESVDSHGAGSASPWHCDEPAGEAPATVPASRLDPQPRSASPVRQPIEDRDGNKPNWPPREQPSGGTPTTREPSANPDARRNTDAARDHIRHNDLPSALKDVKAGLQADPNDEALKELDKLLTKRIQNPVDAKNLDVQIQALTDPRLDSLPGGPSSGALANLTAMNVVKPSMVGHAVTEFKPPPPQGALQPAYVHIRMKDYSAADKYLTQKIHENPLDWQAYRLRALARFKQGNYRGAIEDANGALNINRRDIWILNTMAMALMKLDQVQQAMDVLREALGLNPKNAETYFTRSQLWQKMGKEEERLADLKEAAKYDDQFKTIYEDALNEARRRSGSRRRLPAGALGLVGALILAALIAPLARAWKLKGLAALPVPEPEAPAGPLALMPGTRFGDFEIVRPIGRGGMGVVFEASDLLLGRAVAIKRLREEIAGDPKERQRFLKEARIVASLDHPHIVRIHSVLDRPEGLYLVFEYVAGEPLDRLLDREKKLSFGDVLRHLKTVGAALDYAHQRGIVHRDLKPANVMITRDGVAKVMDFGIAWKAQDTMSRLTRKDGATIVGTPLYMAPEQSWGECVRESDIYALGMCCYEMLAGRVPFDGPNPHQSKLDKRYAPLSRLVRRAPQALDAVIEKALDPAHANRYHSAEEFLKALEAVLPAESRT